MRTLILTTVFLFFKVLVFAQEKDVNVDVNLNKNGGGGGIFTNWYVWAGLVVLLLLVIVAISGRRKAD
jgi:LPXTG-motif cell wall-anchored protein